MCGLAGYYSNTGTHAAQTTYDVTCNLSHRGQESWKLCTSNGDRIRSIGNMGNIVDAVTSETLEMQYARLAVAFLRYPTRGSDSDRGDEDESDQDKLRSTGPFIIQSGRGAKYLVASNGDVRNYDELASHLNEALIYLETKNDGELLGKYIVFLHEIKKYSIVDAIKYILQIWRGATSGIFVYGDEMYIFRDLFGFRPLVIGKVGEDIVVASETCATDVIMAEEVREVEPGEVIMVKGNEVFSYPSDNQNKFKHSFCIFEFTYFARPDSYQFGEYVSKVRYDTGSKLAEDDLVEIDAVVPIFDSGLFASQGYAEAKNIQLRFGLLRNLYVGRTFIRPSQKFRENSVRLKHNPLKDFFRTHPRVVICDDSIVRGTTLKKLVSMTKRAGAREVHLRIATPPVRFSCHYGIDTPNREKLIAAKKSVEEIREFIGADSLKYLSVEGLKACVQKPNKYCYACFTGDYPV